jgi:hypothetical protein
LDGILRALVKNGNYDPYLSSPNRPFLAAASWRPAIICSQRPFIVDVSLIDVIVQRPNYAIDAAGQTQVKS